MNDIKCSVIDNECVAADTYLLRLGCENDIKWKPGQFVMLKVSEALDPFLRRPFSILGYKDGILSILYRVKGRATSMLSKKLKNQSLMLLGPFGNGFTSPTLNGEAIYVAGGIGLPPILAMAERLRKGHIIIGARTSDELALIDRISDISGVDAIITTDDGSMGMRGTATDVLENYIGGLPLNSVIYSCGPYPMLRKVYEVSKEHELRCEVSLEGHMACGFGVCHGCTVKTYMGNRLICKDGPCFDASSILWED